MTDSIHERLLRGEFVQIGNKIYKLCPACKQVIRVNKPLIGDLHFCITDETQRKLP